jgi:hypothetical protein
MSVAAMMPLLNGPRRSRYVVTGVSAASVRQFGEAVESATCHEEASGALDNIQRSKRPEISRI